MTTVYWGYYSPNQARWFELSLMEPIPALPDIIKSRDVGHPKHFTRCPAFKETYKNTFVIKSPIDIEITYDKDAQLVTIEPQGQNFFNQNIFCRGHLVGINDSFLMSFAVHYLFIADNDCDMELKVASMHDSDFINKTRLIEGTFNVGKWYRPIELAFELKDLEENVKIKIKRGDALAYVKFIPIDGNKIDLKYKDFPAETSEAVKACLFVKDLDNKLSLKTLYELSERVRNKLWFNKKKCPFNWRKND